MDVKLLKPLLLACTSVSLIACQQQVVADPNEPAQTGDQQPNTSTVSLPLTTIEQDTSLTLNASDVLYRYQFYGEQPFLSNQDSLIEPIADSASNEFGVNLGELFPAQMVDSQYYNLAAPISSSANSVEYSLDTSLYCASFNYESNQEVLDCAADATGFSLHIAAHSFESGIANIKFEGNTVLQLGYQPERLVLVMDLDNQSDIQPSDVSMSGKLAWLYNLSWSYLQF